MAPDDEPTREASSSPVSFSSIREKAPPVEEGARPTIDYINNVIDGLLQAPLVQRPIELDGGSGTRPLDTEREILASMLGRHSTGIDVSKNDLPGRLKARIGIEIPAELEGEPLRLVPELGSSTPREAADEEPDAHYTAASQASPSLAANQGPERQMAPVGPLARKKSSFSPPWATMGSVMLERPLPSIPESAAQEQPIGAVASARQTSPETSDVLLPNLQTSTDLDSEADIHPAFRSRRNNAPLRLFRGASKFLNAAQFNDTGRQDVARPASSYDSQPVPSILDRQQRSPPPRRHRYSRSTSDLASHNRSDFPPRRIPLMRGLDLPDQSSQDSNALGIYAADSRPDSFDSDINLSERLPPNDQSHTSSRSIAFDEMRAARTTALVAENVAPSTGHPPIVNRSNSSLDRRLTHKKGVSQFNREHHQSLDPSRTTPVRPPPPLSQPADQVRPSLPQSDSSTLYPYPEPWGGYPAPPHAYPRPPATQGEEEGNDDDDTFSTQAEADSMNHDAAIAEYYQPSAIERIAAVMGTTAPAVATQLQSEETPSVVRERIKRDFVDDEERAMRRFSGGVRRVSLVFYVLLTLTYKIVGGKKENHHREI